MTDVAVIGFAQARNERHSPATTNGVEMLVPIFHEVFAATGLTKNDIGFWCSGSSDYRRVPAGDGVARGDGRRLGAV